MKVTYLMIPHTNEDHDRVNDKVCVFLRELEAAKICEASSDYIRADEWPSDSIQELLDLLELHKKQTKEKEAFSDLVRMVMDSPEDQLKHLGIKTYGEGLVNYAKSHFTKLNKLVRDHIRKYPDR